MLGADYRKVLPLDEMTPDDKLDFLAAWAQGHRVVAQGDRKAVLEVGQTNWHAADPDGQARRGWVFDTRAGADEMITRRIGRNELAAMEAVLAYFDAQKEYARKERQPGMGLVYAQKFFSTPGKQDGLYWDDARRAKSPARWGRPTPPPPAMAPITVTTSASSPPRASTPTAVPTTTASRVA